MIVQLVLLLISLWVFCSYVGFVWAYKSIHKSISDSYYSLPNKLKPLFTLALWGVAIPVMIAGNDMTMFFAGAGIAFVGAAPAFSSHKIEKGVHMAGAIIGISFGLLGLFFMFKEYAIAGIGISLVLILLGIRPKNFIWWIEIIAFLTIIIGLLHYYHL